MGVRPLDGLVAIAECATRFEADTAVARLAASGIDALVLADPTPLPPHMGMGTRFPVVVPIAIADDAQQVLARAGIPTGVRDPSLLASPPPPPDRPGRAIPPSPDGRRPSPRGDGFRRGWAPGFDGDGLSDQWDDGDDDRSPSASPGRPRWVKPVALITAASVVLPALITAIRAIFQL